MITLVEFLVARLAEDERLATRAASLCGCCTPSPNWQLNDDEAGGRITVDNPHNLKLKLTRRWNGSYGDLFIGEHIAAHDPARVLREVEAKRKILAQHAHLRFAEPLDPNSKFEEDRRPAFDEAPRYVGCERCSYDRRHEEVFPGWWCDHLRLLALAYSDHPDYRSEWSPS